MLRPEDARLIVSVVSYAQRGADYLHGLQPAHLQLAEAGGPGRDLLAWLLHLGSSDTIDITDWFGNNPSAQVATT